MPATNTWKTQRQRQPFYYLFTPSPPFCLLLFRLGLRDRVRFLQHSICNYDANSVNNYIRCMFMASGNRGNPSLFPFLFPRTPLIAFSAKLSWWDREEKGERFLQASRLPHTIQGRQSLFFGFPVCRFVFAVNLVLSEYLFFYQFSWICSVGWSFRSCTVYLLRTVLRFFTKYVLWQKDSSNVLEGNSVYDNTVDRTINFSSEHLWLYGLVKRLESVFGLTWEYEVVHKNSNQKPTMVETIKKNCQK